MAKRVPHIGNYTAMFISFVIFNFFNVIFYIFLFNPYLFSFFFVLHIAYWYLHIRIGKHIMNIFVSKRPNIQILKKMNEEKIVTSAYFVLWMLAAYAFRKSGDDVFFRSFIYYFMIMFFSNLIVLNIYKSKYKKIFEKAKLDVKNLNN